jgi:hypothetical protein
MKRLPIGIQTFENIREEGYLYVDKTELVYRMTHEYKYVFLSRPRRFGKSLLCSTLKSYFEGRKDLTAFAPAMLSSGQQWAYWKAIGPDRPERLSRTLYQRPANPSQGGYRIQYGDTDVERMDN